MATRASWVAVGLLVVSATAAAEESFDVWRYEPPPGWSAARKGAYLEMVKPGEPVCMLALYASRDFAGAEAEAVAEEWKLVVEPTFAPGDVRPLGRRTTRRGVTVASTGARGAAGGQSWYVVQHAVVAGKKIGSVVAIAASADTMRACEPEVTAFVDSLATASTPGLAGAWGTSAGGGALGSQKRQYELRPDGSYRYRAEAWGGSLRSDEWTLVDERGRWSVDGDRLTIAPSSAEVVVRGREAVKKRGKLPLEKVTYRWKLVYFEGIGETQLVLTPPKQTARDGGFAANADHPGSYLLSNRYAPEWRFAD